MKDILKIQSLQESELFAKIDGLSRKDKISIIQDQIIPLMNARQGRLENMSTSEIHEKIYNFERSDKPGEEREFFNQLHEDINSNGVTPKLAGETADIAYYGLQSNAGNKDRLEHWSVTLDALLGIPMDSALALCIIKYSTRLKFGDNSNYKEIELKILNEYLSTHPELINLYNPVKSNIPEHETIWEHVSK